MRLAVAPVDSSNPESTASAVMLAWLNSSCPERTANAVNLGSNPDSACGRRHRLQRLTESGSDPNITSLCREWYRTDSCQRILNKGYSLFSYIFPATAKYLQQAKPPTPTCRIGVRAQFGDAPVTHTQAVQPNWDQTPNLLLTAVNLAMTKSGNGYKPTSEVLSAVLNSSHPERTASAVILGSDPNGTDLRNNRMKTMTCVGRVSRRRNPTLATTRASVELRASR